MVGNNPECDDSLDNFIIKKQVLFVLEKKN